MIKATVDPRPAPVPRLRNARKRVRCSIGQPVEKSIVGQAHRTTEIDLPRSSASSFVNELFGGFQPVTWIHLRLLSHRFFELSPKVELIDGVYEEVLSQHFVIDLSAKIY